MATAQQIASPSVYVTDDIGVEVTDGTNVRVQLGLLPGGSYGLRVIAVDGTTVIIDGTSDVFKIFTAGSLSIAAVLPGGSSNTTVNFPALQPATTPPAHMAYLGTAIAATDPRYQTRRDVYSSQFVAATSGGAVTVATFTVPVIIYSLMQLLGGSNDLPTFQVSVGNNGTISTGAFSTRYYILQETAF